MKSLTDEAAEKRISRGFCKGCFGCKSPCGASVNIAMYQDQWDAMREALEEPKPASKSLKDTIIEYLGRRKE